MCALSVHVLGSSRPSNTQDPCPLISAKAIKIAQTKEVFDDEEQPINYRPANPKFGALESDEQQCMAKIGEDPNNDEDEEVCDNNDEDDEADFKSILKANDRALEEAIKTLKKARADIKKKLRQ
ncbi:hypothetical protein BGZ96_004378 [Linnemannia gamsii]|uniref:Uncharacterized protein n=1 Tax=Linnemannia gamsii TaxID=64522 RepID=A0ABQ7JIE9_9FUNG|nr:hypothetical protein BGZ96_004378 [Linnemannia gamsii]